MQREVKEKVQIYSTKIYTTRQDWMEEQFLVNHEVFLVTISISLWGT